ncbi:arsenate reductase family protein [Cetobacterium sp.]|uniref:arsenate reductase family protein n=1 Tax=Cetobacterium sp. TaxID=2071632 RepID=UPI003F38021C
MIVQIFGKKNCNETKKVLRFFKERNLKFQFIDLAEKAPSKRELETFLKNYEIEELLDKNGTEYKKRNLQYLVYDIETLLLENPILFKTPIIRWEKGVFLGYSAQDLKNIK